MNNAMPPDQPDDIDRLFARMNRAAVPVDFTASVLERTRPRTALQWPWLVAGLLAMALLGLAGYLAGASLAATDGLDVLEALFGDFGLLTTAPGDALAALSEVIPWSLVAVAGVSAAFVVWVAGRVVSRTPAVA